MSQDHFVREEKRRRVLPLSFRFMRKEEDWLLEKREDLKHKCDRLEREVEGFFDDPDNRHVPASELDSFWDVYDRHQGKVAEWLEVNSHWMSLSSDFVNLLTAFPSLSD